MIPIKPRRCQITNSRRINLPVLILIKIIEIQLSEYFNLLKLDSLLLIIMQQFQNQRLVFPKPDEQLFGLRVYFLHISHRIFRVLIIINLGLFKIFHYLAKLEARVQAFFEYVLNVLPFFAQETHIVYLVHKNTVCFDYPNDPFFCQQILHKFVFVVVYY